MIQSILWDNAPRAAGGEPVSHAGAPDHGLNTDWVVAVRAYVLDFYARIRHLPCLMS